MKYAARMKCAAHMKYGCAIFYITGSFLALSILPRAILHIPQEYFISRQRYFILLSCSGKYTVDEPVKTMYNTTNSQ